MAEKAHHPSFDWFKLFIVPIAVFNIFLLLMLSQCTYSLKTTFSAFQTALCAGYGALAFATFVAGMFVSFVGLEFAKRKHRSRSFFYFMMLYFLGVAFGFLWYILL